MAEHILFVFMIFCGLGLIWSNIRAFRRTPPNGKAFIKKFVNKVKTIQSVLKQNEVPYLRTTIKNHSFNVKVVNEEAQVGLKYSTIPMHSSKLVYINDEAVCRVHSMDYDFSKKYFLEFSSDRKLNEIIEIIDEVYKIANKLEKDYWNNQFSLDDKSFYKK